MSGAPGAGFLSNSGFRSGNPDYLKQSPTDESFAGSTEESKEYRCAEHYVIYCTTITYTTGQSEPIISRFITTEALHYRTGQMTGMDCTMGSCHINFMYVNSGIDKSLDVSISLTKQIPHKVQTEGLLCSYYPSGTAADRVGYFPQCQSFIPLRDPRGVCSKVGVLGKVLRYWLRKSVRSLKSSTRGIGHT